MAGGICQIFDIPAVHDVCTSMCMYVGVEFTLLCRFQEYQSAQLEQPLLIVWLAPFDSARVRRGNPRPVHVDAA